ncbi:MAG: hypothetical protein M1133_05235 [Armatimonadetes bacterium]|nr:hypothetical protein [Armatimonadota bacterium]
MSVVIRVHFDGKTLVPEEPVDLPINESIEAELRVAEVRPGRSPEREAAWQRLLSLRISGLDVPDFALSRESMYWPPRGL